MEIAMDVVHSSSHTQNRVYQILLSRIVAFVEQSYGNMFII